MPAATMVRHRTIEWAEPERQTRAVKEYLAALEAESEPKSGPQTAEGHLAERSPVSLDSENQQTGAVRIRTELPDRYRERGNR
jgi:predicted acetyltransferase